MMKVSRPNLDYAAAQLFAAGEEGYLNVGEGQLTVKQFKQAVFHLRKKGYDIKRVHESKFACRYFIVGNALTDMGPPRPPVPVRLLAWIKKNPGLTRSDMLVIAAETTTRSPLNDLMQAGQVFSVTKYRGGNMAIYFASEAERDAYLLTQPERPDTSARKRELARIRYAKEAGEGYKPQGERVHAQQAHKAQRRATPGQSISMTPKTPKKAGPAFSGPADYSRAVVTQCPGFKPRDLSAGATPYFSALAIGSYAPSKTHLAQVYGEAA